MAGCVTWLAWIALEAVLAAAAVVTAAMAIFLWKKGVSRMLFAAAAEVAGIDWPWRWRWWEYVLTVECTQAAITEARAEDADSKTLVDGEPWRLRVRPGAWSNRPGAGSFDVVERGAVVCGVCGTGRWRWRWPYNVLSSEFYDSIMGESVDNRVTGGV